MSEDYLAHTDEARARGESPDTRLHTLRGELMTIFKYVVPRELEFQHDMPEGAKILTVALQHGEPRIWALVDFAAEVKPRKFRVLMTGEPIEGIPGTYVGTYQLDDGFFVGHLFVLE